MLAAFVVCAAIAGCSSNQAALRTRGETDLPSDPPEMLSLDVQPLGNRELRLFVRYEPDPRLGRNLTLNFEQGPVTFHREKDGRYVGNTRLTERQADELAERDRRLGALGAAAVHQNFVDRVVTDAPIPVQPLQLLSAHAGASQHSDDALPVVQVPIAYLSVGALVQDAKSVLTITDRAVVGDKTRTWDPCDAGGTKNGKWTFGYLVRKLAGTSGNASQMTSDWLATWQTAQTVGTRQAGPRPLISNVIDKWPHVGSTLDLDEAPMRLLAIVNRIDLADNLTFAGNGKPGTAGELRFVFDVAPRKANGKCSIKKFAVIFEYRVSASNCMDVKAWAERWIALGKMTRGGPAYNQALEAITEDVVSGKLGQLAQIRTNELDLGQAVNGTTLWEMREFGLESGKLALRFARRVPVDSQNRTETLSTWVNAHATDISNLTHEVPASDAGPNPQMARETFWDGARGGGLTAIADHQVRFQFSSNTCTGCHARETCTGFNHVIANAAGKEAGLSHFLTGGQIVPDPVTCEATCPLASSDPCAPGTLAACCRTFHDLELRRQRLDSLTNCTMPNGYVPLHAVH